jgi:RNA polymerase sigma-70 factor (ECF subfamily)
MTESTPETDLIKQAQRGDRRAFERILQAHYDVMYRMAYKWCGNGTDAEDITQIACIKLARSIESYRFQSAFLTWLYPLVINTAKDWARARARHGGAPAAETEIAQEPVAEGNIFAAQIMAQVRALPDKERQAIFLVFSEGLSHREASVVMECKESTVSWYIHEARKKLQPFRTMECHHG